MSVLAKIDQCFTYVIISGRISFINDYIDDDYKDFAKKYGSNIIYVQKFDNYIYDDLKEIKEHIKYGVIFKANLKLDEDEINEGVKNEIDLQNVLEFQVKFDKFTKKSGNGVENILVYKINNDNFIIFKY